MSPRPLGDVVARGSRSLVHAYGRGAVVKVPKPTTPSSWIRAEAEYVEAVRAVGAPGAALLGVGQIFGRPAGGWGRGRGWPPPPTAARRWGGGGGRAGGRCSSSPRR